MNSFVTILTKTISKKVEINTNEGEDDHFYKGSIMSLQEFSYLKHLCDNSEPWFYKGPLALQDSGESAMQMINEYDALKVMLIIDVS